MEMVRHCRDRIYGLFGVKAIAPITIGAFLRVSTQRQQRSGLGIEAQRAGSATVTASAVASAGPTPEHSSTVCMDGSSETWEP
jgi:hypothetical protein